MQEEDAERRIQILRGLPVTIKTPKTDDDEQHRLQERGRDHDGPRRDRKRRRIAGEDDTERDIRVARENNAIVPAKPTIQSTPRNGVPSTDGKGNINLFPVETFSKNKAPKNTEAETEAAKKKKEFEDQFTMRFSNAAGLKQAVGQQPWYNSMDVNAGGEGAAITKDVWGNEDPRRKDREKMRLNANDPLAAIHKGVEDLRAVETERKRWREERDREIQELVDTERPSQSRRRKRRRGKRGKLEHEDLGLSLHAPPPERISPVQEPSSRQHHRSRSRDRSHPRRRRHRHRRDSRGPTETLEERCDPNGSLINQHHTNRGHKSHALVPDKEEVSSTIEKKLRQERHAHSPVERGKAAAPIATGSDRPSSAFKPAWERASRGSRYSSQFAAA